MRTSHTELTEQELTLLEHQYYHSPLGQRQNQVNKETLTKLVIFDFDSTLFLSPLLSSTLWDDFLVNAVTTENLFGPGFWRDIRSLQVGNDGLAQWEGWWNEDVVLAARQAIQDPHTVTVLLTGRRAHPFAALVEQMLCSKQLTFDMVGLRPDPSLSVDMSSTKTDLGFNEQPDIFPTTMDFKACFILHLRSRIPSLQHIIMWDDRRSHQLALQEFISTLINNGYFMDGHLESVEAIRPKYNPQWELALVENMLATHNQALEKKCTSSASTMRVMVDTKGNMVDSYDPVQLVRRPYAMSSDPSVLRLTPCSVDRLKKTFDSFYQQHMETMKQTQPSWRYLHGEQPVFFGDIVFDTTVPFSCSSPTIRKITTMDDTQYITLVVTGWDIGSTMDRGITLRVEVKESSSSDKQQDSPFILPLWYKPSTFQRLPSLPYKWTYTHGTCDDLYLKAYSDHVYLYGIEKK
ncbi:uncharacterized protein BX664DRAFT_271439 [Halteromyces radiatus]|uniref:uncharacterized protein n=1 Tax=Halteromyces radiatus TaxID=101107 RepID=UPI00221E5316|nr:uncharacterized protein BX664DRAFT_271439 [Halteromyces radiatus]KAI8098688.1 hypothetical protein BX664DRAFT_271439 [Halteromyces radiatus]